jgi:putative transposase
MDDNESLAHAKWECKYHVVWIPKYRRKALYGELRKHLGPVLRELARQRECVVEEGHLNLDHVHMLLSIPPKYAVAQVLGFIKGKSAIHIARTYLGRRQNFTGQHFWARGYYVSTVGRDEATIREYIKKQEAEDRRLDQLEIFARYRHLQVALGLPTALSGSHLSSHHLWWWS